MSKMLDSIPTSPERKAQAGATWFVIRQHDSPAAVLAIYELARLCGVTYKGTHKRCGRASLEALSIASGIHERRLSGILTRLEEKRVVLRSECGRWSVNPKALAARHKALARRGRRNAGWWAVGRIPEILRDKAKEIRPRGRIMAGIAQHRYEQALKAAHHFRTGWAPTFHVLAEILGCCVRTVKRWCDRVLPEVGLRADPAPRKGGGPSARFVHFAPALSFTSTTKREYREAPSSRSPDAPPEKPKVIPGGEAVFRNLLFELVGDQRGKLNSAYRRPRHGGPAYAEDQY